MSRTGRPSGLATYWEISSSVIFHLLQGHHDCPLPVGFAGNLGVSTVPIPRHRPFPPSCTLPATPAWQPHCGLPGWEKPDPPPQEQTQPLPSWQCTEPFCSAFQNGAVSVPGLGTLPDEAVTWSCLLLGHSRGLTSYKGFIRNLPEFILIF